MKRRGRALKRRYGRASGGHPLLPRLVMRLTREMRGNVPGFFVTGEIQRHYGGPWVEIFRAVFTQVRVAREALRNQGPRLAREHNVPADHVEYVT